MGGVRMAGATSREEPVTTLIRGLNAAFSRPTRNWHENQAGLEFTALANPGGASWPNNGLQPAQDAVNEGNRIGREKS
jgi:hypothetical protein